MVGNLVYRQAVYLAKDQEDEAQVNLRDMTKRITDNCMAKGWYDEPVTFGTAMALLASEASEALDSWRKWGLHDRTPQLHEWGSQPDPEYGRYMPKPEGVGSEFADILIRLLDYCARFGVDLVTAAELHKGLYGIHDEFADNIFQMHVLIVLAGLAYENGDFVNDQFAGIYVFLNQLCDEYGINLEKETERKMAYNETRPYRHGNRKC